MAQILKLGIIGLSEGNGHPYSWSAIFNGYDKIAMQDCGFPVIPEYLNRQSFPSDGLSHLGKVTHVWTQDFQLSEKIAKAALIDQIVSEPEEMIGKVDAVLLARDDAENHFAMAKPFIEANVPIYIDKPLSLSKNEAKAMFKLAKSQNSVYSCSALRFAKELFLTDEEQLRIGDIQFVRGTVMKKWSTYAVHLLEPLVSQCKNRGTLLNVESSSSKGIKTVNITWSNLMANLTTSGSLPMPLSLTYFGLKGNITKNFSDSFACFKATLIDFIEVINHRKENIPREETLEIIEILEKGLEA